MTVELRLIKGILLAEMIQTALLDFCLEENKIPEDLENNGDLDRIINRAIANTEIELCEGARIELTRKVFQLIQDYICNKSKGETKTEIQAIYVKYNANQSEIEKVMDKAKTGLESANTFIEQGKEIYQEAKPVISTVMAVIKLLGIFFKK